MTTDILNKLGEFKSSTQMVSKKSGNPVRNQFVLYFENGLLFRSYDSNVGIRLNDGSKYIDAVFKYSRTTSKYTNHFFNTTPRELTERIHDGDIVIIDLN